MRFLFSVVAALLVFVHGAEPPSPSSTPCAQNYVCPEPRPYDLAQFPDTGDVPPADQFKCRIGWSESDPNFAFCYYNKNTGVLVGATPSGFEEFCWEAGMRNPACTTTRRRREAEGVPRRPTTTSPRAIADSVNVARFTKRQTVQKDKS